YYIYATIVSNAIALLASTVGHQVSASDGTEVMVGDATKALVGMIYVNSGGQFAGNLVRSWFNRIPVSQFATATAVLSFTSPGAYTRVDPSHTTLAFVAFSDDVVS